MAVAGVTFECFFYAHVNKQEVYGTNSRALLQVLCESKEISRALKAECLSVAEGRRLLFMEVYITI